MNPVEVYIRDLRDIHSSGQAVKETSYYGVLANLFNAIGKTLKPKIHCIINIKNRGAGIPDGGLFTPDQIQRVTEDQRFISQIPSRGVIEVKSTEDDVQKIANREQVIRYLSRYGQVLVTNYRDFLLIGQDINGNPTQLETYQLADNETDFWNATNNPHTLAEVHSEQFTEYLKRVMLYAAPLAKPEDVAWFLASYARDAKSRIEKVDLPALASIRNALEEALGIKFEGKKGEHFFRSTLVQTLFYGIFSAWVLWSKQHSSSDKQAYFSWKEASWSLHVPMIKALFEQVATPRKLGALNLVEVLDWTGSALNRVNRATFFSKFEEEHAVQYFYEPFLEAFDPDLRKELGVWYTPKEIVRYMVARVDMALREELGIEDGLADPQVYVLDPCCGTGTYLIEVLKSISATLEEKGEDALGGYDIKKAAMERIFGFEILPAPFVVAHLQLGLMLQQLGTPLSNKKEERVGIYLTNSLTGWEPPDPVKEKIIQLNLEGMPELKEERDAAGQIKRNVPILVILGNPPYNAFAGVSPKEEQSLVEPYKKGLISEWGIKKFNLDDLYIRFFRLAEHRIAEQTGKGIVCYISNFSYLSDPSFVVMRQRFLKEFDELWFDNMNGDSRETGKLTPEGKPDPSVFSTNYNREGIRVGTTIGLMIRKTERNIVPIVRFHHYWGTTKRNDLLHSLENKNFNAQYERVNPERNNRFSFKPLNIAPHYFKWPSLIDISGRSPFAGMAEDRRKALIAIDRSVIQTRMKMYFDSNVDWETLAELRTCLTTDVPRFDAKRTRKALIKAEVYDENRILRFLMRPFDVQWCYYSPVRPLWREPRPDYWASYKLGSPAIVTRFQAAMSPEGSPLLFTRQFCDYHSMPPNASVFPFFLNPSAVEQRNQVISQNALFQDINTHLLANFSPEVYTYLNSLSIINSDTGIEAADLVWLHALAIGYSPVYLAENADGIRQDYPRIPLPNNKELLLRSSELGRKLADLLDVESSLPGITKGRIRSEIRTIGNIRRTDAGSLDPNSSDLEVSVGWGHSGKDGTTMPGKGKIVEREYMPEEKDAILQGTEIFGLGMEEALKHLGEKTCDIYLNKVAYWKNIPFNVWNYHIGGYQVIKKWLSYREYELLGRALTVDEIREVTSIARRITAILLLEPELNSNYQATKYSTYSWPSRKDK